MDEGLTVNKGNQMTYLTLEDIRLNFWPNQGFFQITIVFGFYQVVLFSILKYIFLISAMIYAMK